MTNYIFHVMNLFNWFLLIHQLPPKPLYLRAKIRQRLTRIGAIALKNSVYVLPYREESLEDLQWIVQEAVGKGGEAYICKADFDTPGVNDRIIEKFKMERKSDYEELSKGLEDIARKIQRRIFDASLRTRLNWIKKRLEEIISNDFFQSPGRNEAESLIKKIEEAMTREKKWGKEGKPRKSIKDPGQTWVTRKDIHIDRMASAWLIRRFIDPQARFLFVDQNTYEKKPEDIRFDMPEGEFTHEGDRCTFEILLVRSKIRNAALSKIAEMIHDVDLKDQKFGRSEAQGIDLVLRGLIYSTPEDDEARLDRAILFFDDLYKGLKG